ncbi:MAG: Appr-1-p processing protein [Chloroflexi bacterium]|nr:MAG: Appr-1-p processing protein [Chloroflexota bacterium]
MKIILADLQIQVVTAWQQHFHDYSNVKVFHGSIFDVHCDALVSPANSFGFMDGGIEMAISRHFGWHVQERVQEVIQSKRHGELLVGTAINKSVQRVAIPGMGTGVGKFPPDLCAKQMKQAIDDMLLEKYIFPNSWSDAQKRHQRLYGDDYRDLQHW